MVEAKFLRYVTVPTNRSMRFHDVGQLIQLDCIPGQQISFRSEKAWPMVHPVKFWKRSVAIDAILVAIPSH
jgi:hypothetical protein